MAPDGRHPFGRLYWKLLGDDALGIQVPGRNRDFFCTGRTVLRHRVLGNLWFGDLVGANLILAFWED
jgi:hypothetical protein